MKEFLLLFRSEITQAQELSAEQKKANMKPWQDWLENLASQDKLSNSGNPLGNEGKVVKPGNVITNGPFAELKEAIGGYIIIKAKNLDNAAELAKGCPILNFGGNVEVRPVVPMDGTN